MTPPGTRLVVGAILVDSLTAPTRVLGCRRTTPPALAGRWEFPGGKVEPGEAPTGALARELREELGVDPVVGEEVVGGPRPGGRWPIDERHDLALFLAALPAGVVVSTSTDHDEVRWLGADELDTVPWLDSDAQALDALRARLP